MNMYVHSIAIHTVDFSCMRLNIPRYNCEYRKYMLWKMWCFALQSMGHTNPYTQHGMFKHNTEINCTINYRKPIYTQAQPLHSGRCGLIEISG